MKLASQFDGTRDGRLLVVSRDLGQAVPAQSIADTLQEALDDWAHAAPRLQELAERLEAGRAPGAFALDMETLMAPLPRTYHWVDASGYLNHVRLVRRARGAEMPPDAHTNPVIYQGGGDDMLPWNSPIPVADEGWGADLEAEVVAITVDVEQSTEPAVAAEKIALLTLVNDVTLRNLVPAELAKGFGFYQSKPASALAPVAVTPDELGSSWTGRAVDLELSVYLNGEPFGHPNAATDLTFDFTDLIGHLTKTRRLGAGTLIGSGTVSNEDPGTGEACIAERRCIETIECGEPRTPFLSWGDTVRIEMIGRDGQSVFGAIENRVVPLQNP